jgi:hypothetical protein
VLENMLARDGVERFRTVCFQQLADSTMDRKDTKDRKDSFCVRFVCGFFSPSFSTIGSGRPTRKLWQNCF